MPGLHIERLKVRRRFRLHQTRLWREWCFLRVALRRYWLRFVLMAVVIVGGGMLFQIYEPEKNHSLPRASYYAWSLVFAQNPEEFPRAPVLQALFFLMPVIGLTVIIESIVDFALLLRDRRRAERFWCETMAHSLSNHVILVGLGRLGFSIYSLLHKLGESIVVIELDADNQFLEQVRRDGRPLFIADGRREMFLEQANVAKARSLIAATSDDLANLEICLDARRVNPNIRVVLRMFDQHMADKVRGGFNIHLAMSESALSAPSFAMVAVERSIVGSFVVGDRLVIMLNCRVHADGPWIGRTIGELTRELGVGIAEHKSAAAAHARLFPDPQTRLLAGDEILIQAPYETLDSLRPYCFRPG